MASTVLVGGTRSASGSPILRNGESCSDTKPSRTGFIRLLVKVWAAAVWPRPISARHAKNPRKKSARLRRPGTGPDITIKKPQHNHSLGDHPRFLAGERVV